MIKLSENIIRWIIAVPCILLTVCLVLYRAYRHSASDRERLALSLEEFRDKEKKSVLIQRVSQQMEEIAYQQKDISETGSRCENSKGQPNATAGRVGTGKSACCTIGG